MSSTIVEGKDTVKFVNEEEINQAAAAASVVVEEKKEQAEETEQEEPASAFNPETGEINWDCPCKFFHTKWISDATERERLTMGMIGLGGMAQGPCGEEFKAAFSCFVFSEAEPKGLDCVEKFKGMQDCFRLHPDVYGDEIDDDDEEEEEEKKEEQKEETKEQPTVSSANEETSFSSWVSSWF